MNTDETLDTLEDRELERALRLGFDHDGTSLVEFPMSYGNPHPFTGYQWSPISVVWHGPASRYIVLDGETSTFRRPRVLDVDEDLENCWIRAELVSFGDACNIDLERVNNDFPVEPIEGDPSVGWTTNVEFEANGNSFYATFEGRVQGNFALRKHGPPRRERYQVWYTPFGFKIPCDFERLKDAKQFAGRVDDAFGSEDPRWIDDFVDFLLLIAKHK